MINTTDFWFITRVIQARRFDQFQNNEVHCDIRLSSTAYNKKCKVVKSNSFELLFMLIYMSSTSQGQVRSLKTEHRLFDKTGQTYPLRSPLLLKFVCFYHCNASLSCSGFACLNIWSSPKMNLIVPHESQFYETRH